jgi:hypothetical protein
MAIVFAACRREISEERAHGRAFDITAVTFDAPHRCVIVVIGDLGWDRKVELEQASFAPLQSLLHFPFKKRSLHDTHKYYGCVKC